MNRPGSCFITGTDTGVGKTRVTAALMTAFRERGHRALGMKPVATGCTQTPAGLRNDDAELIRSCCDEQTPYELINPYAFEEPVAPLFAARSRRVVIEQQVIEAAFRQLSDNAEAVMVEGVGGWRMPLGPGLQLADIVRSLRLRVIMVVGLRLGCINHALLTAGAIRADGLVLSAWVANRIDPGYHRNDETLQLLTDELQAPLLGVIPYAADFNRAETAGRLAANAMEILSVDG